MTAPSRPLPSTLTPGTKRRTSDNAVAPSAWMSARVATVTDSVTVKKLLQLLPERDREVVIRRYAWDESQKEVADDLGVSPSRVSQIGREGLRTLLHGLERRDEGDD